MNDKIFLMNEMFTKNVINNTNHNEIINYISNDIALQPYLCDILWLNFKKYQNNLEVKNKLIDIAKLLLQDNLINKDNLLEKLDENILHSLGLIEDEKAFTQKIKIITTKLFYQQEKYNLLREESEGYIKLAYILYETIFTYEEIKTTILNLIGYFDLDPNKVLEIELTILLASSDEKRTILIELICNTHKKEQIVQILQLKNQSEYLNQNNKNEFFELIVILLQKHFFNINELISFISFEEEKKESNEVLSKITKYFNSFKSNRDIPFQNEKKTLASAATLSLGSNDISELNDNIFDPIGTLVHLYNYSYTKIYKYLQENNYFSGVEVSPKSKDKYIMLKHLINKRMKTEVLRFFPIIENNFDCLSNDELISELCNLISWQIDILYDELSPLKRLKNKNKMIVDVDNNNNNEYEYIQYATYEEFINEIPNILSILKFGLYKDIKLTIKLLKIIWNLMRNETALYKQNEDKIKTLLKNVLLPTISLIDTAPSELSYYINLIFESLSINDRYDLYYFWLNDMYFTHPSLYLRYAITIRDSNKWLNLINKDRIKSSARELQITTNTNPTIILNHVIRYMINYNNYFEIFLNSLVYMNNFLQTDIIIFVFSSMISDPNTEKQYNYRISKNYKKLGQNISLFFKKFPNLDFSNIFLYLINQIKDSTMNYCDMFILKEVLINLVGIQIEEEMKFDQVLSFAGQEILIIEGMDILKDFKSYKKSITSLVDLFYKMSLIVHKKENGLEINLAFMILIICGIKREYLLFANHEQQETRLVTTLFDEYHNVFLQLIHFVSMEIKGCFLIGTSNTSILANLFANVDLCKVIESFKISPEILFHIIRFSLTNYLDIAEDEFSSNVEKFANVLETYNKLNHDQYIQDEEIIDLDNNKFLDDIFNTSKLWTFFPKEFYYIFYSLKLNDIYFPEKLYNIRLENLNILLKEKQQELESNQAEYQKNKKEVDRIKFIIHSLKEDKAKSINIVKNTKSKLKLLKFDILKESRKEVSKYIIKYCFLPRLILSKEDALYVAKLFGLLVNNCSSYINVLDFLSKLLKIIIPSLLGLSNFESENLGIFLNELFSQIYTWQTPSIWKIECENNPCFYRNFEGQSFINEVDFKDVYSLVMQKIADNFKSYMELEEYCSAKNTLIVMNNISEIFPASKKSCIDLEKSISKVKEKFINSDDLTTRLGRFIDNLQKKIQVLTDDEQPKDKLNAKEIKENKDTIGKDALNSKEKNLKEEEIKKQNSQRQVNQLTKIKRNKKERSLTPEMKRKDDDKKK